MGNATFGFTAFNGTTNLGSFTLPPLAVDPTTYNLTSVAGQNFSSFTLDNLVSPPSGLGVLK